VPHNRGFLNEHSKNIQRGELVTGAAFCDGSNTKPAANLKTVRFTGLCTNCVSTVKKESRETYPGSLEQYGGVMTVQCPECGSEGDYCSNCDEVLHEFEAAGDIAGTLAEPVDEHETQLYMYMQASDVSSGHIQAIRDQFSLPVSDARITEMLAGPPLVKAWVNKLGVAECPDGQLHQNVHRHQEDRPVLLTDSHVIVEPSDD
jgi:hypothetical protein